jgi:hypothetical protein
MSCSPLPRNPIAVLALSSAVGVLDRLRATLAPVPPIAINASEAGNRSIVLQPRDRFIEANDNSYYGFHQISGLLRCFDILLLDPKKDTVVSVNFVFQGLEISHNCLPTVFKTR